MKPLDIDPVHIVFIQRSFISSDPEKCPHKQHTIIPAEFFLKVSLTPHPPTHSEIFVLTPSIPSIIISKRNTEVDMFLEHKVEVTGTYESLLLTYKRAPHAGQV